jgi:Na+-transporting NADH:ubiquinone oxidoreductase subunit A
MKITVRKGLDLRLGGQPEQRVDDAKRVRTVALVGPDYTNLKPTLAVAQGDRVRHGQTLFTDRRFADVRYTSPASGRVLAIRRGARRRLLSVVIEVGDDEPLSFEPHDRRTLSRLPHERVRRELLESGLWTALRARPFDAVPPPDAMPQAIVVTAMDTNPLAVDPAVVIGRRPEAFVDGVAVLGALGAPLFVCKSPGLALPEFPSPAPALVEFAGPHPAGLPGTHIAHLAPVSEERPAWHLGYQDAIAIGDLFVSGQLSSERIVAVGGPGAVRPRLLRTRIGAALDELLDGETLPGARVVSGSALSGRATTPETAYLGRYHTQIAVLDEPPQPDAARSLRETTATTALHGWPGGMIPLERFERVWPFAAPVLPFLRALLVGDVDAARRLGCLDFAEEDLATCAYVCPSKQDYGAALRAVLDELEPGVAR